MRVKNVCKKSGSTYTLILVGTTDTYTNLGLFNLMALI